MSQLQTSLGYIALMLIVGWVIYISSKYASGGWDAVKQYMKGHTALLVFFTVVVGGYAFWVGPQILLWIIPGSPGLRILQTAVPPFAPPSVIAPPPTGTPLPPASPGPVVTPTEVIQPVIGQPFAYERFDTDVPVTVLVDLLQLKHWSSPIWDMGPVAADTLPNGQGTAVGKKKDASGQWWLVAKPGSAEVVFPASQVDWQAAGITLDPPTATPAAGIDHLKCGLAWVEWAKDHLASTTGSAMVPLGYEAEILTKDGSFTLEIPLLGVQGISVTAEQAAAAPGAKFTGTGTQCQSP